MNLQLLNVIFNSRPQIPANIYLLKVNNRNTRKRCETCSKLTIKTPERDKWRRSGVFIVNFEHISKLFLVFLFSVPIPRHESRLSHVNIFLRHYGGQLKTAVEQEAVR